MKAVSVNSRFIMSAMSAAIAAIAVLSVSPTAVLASDAEYLQALQDITSDDPLVNDVVVQLGSDNNIRMAKGVCSLLNSPKVTTIEHLVAGVIEQQFFNVPAPNLPEDDDSRAAAVGGYIAATMITGTPAYCSQHSEKINAMFK